MLKYLAAVAFLGVCCAHVCILTPHQRGTLQNPLPSPSVDCDLMSSPCGGRPRETPNMTYKPGDKVSITFQKNRSHYQRNNTGLFKVNIIKEGHGMITEIDKTTVADDNHTVRNYTTSLMIPNNFQGHNLILQVIYESNLVVKNQAYIFYSCADLAVNTH